MPHPFSPRLPLALAGTAAILAGAAPAGASEGPVRPPTPGVPPISIGLTPVVIPQIPVPTPGHRRHARPKIRSARIVPHRVRAHHRARLHLRLSSRGRLRLVTTRLSRPGRGKVSIRTVRARGRKVVVRLSKRFHGHALRPGRYRVTVRLIDPQGRRSRPVRRSFVVRPARR